MVLMLWDALPAHAGSGPPDTSADLAIALTGSPNPVVRGGLLTYTAVLTNRGPDPVTEVNVHLRLPADSTLVSASLDVPAGPGACHFYDGAVGCSTFFYFGPTTTATPRTATVVVRVSGTSGQSVTATATASPAWNFMPPPPPSDPDLTNNVETVVTTIEAPANVPGLDRYGLILVALLFGLLGLVAVSRQQRY